MRIPVFKITLFSLLLTFCVEAFPQQYSLGGSAIYNFSAKNFGLGFRVEFPVEKVTLLEGLSIAPQVSYFPWFNRVSEIYIGSSVHLGVYRHRTWLFYGLLNVSYNGWINYQDSEDEDAKFSHPGVDIGAGVTRRKCRWRPFAELRLNFVGVEPNIRAGMLYTFNCRIRGQVPCSKIPPQPTFEQE